MSGQWRKRSKGKGIKKAERGRERGKEGRHICSTHLSAKRYNYLSQHIIHVLYQPRAPCLCLATLTTHKGHILTLAMTVYLRKENCPLGYGEREKGRGGERVREKMKGGRRKSLGSWQGEGEKEMRWRQREKRMCREERNRKQERTYIIWHTWCMRGVFFSYSFTVKHKKASELGMNWSKMEALVVSLDLG